jgi:serine/threonine protein kinase
MAATLSTDQFLDVLRKSELVDEKRLQGFLQSSSLNLPTNSRELGQQLVREGLLTPFQVAQLLAGKWKGFLLASRKYKLLERLGAGGMGQVFLCEHVRMKRLVALKVLPIDKIKDDESAVARFEREARAAAALDHPNIVRAHDIDTDGKMHFLVMEYVDGASLQEIIKKHGPLEINRACHYIADAARGLQHAHEAGWVHRDVKPGNLLLDRNGTIKLLDMGLARLFADDTDNLTKRYEKNAVLGTADYLAPEQATNSSDVDIRADIYSLGATMYYLLTGRGPFDDGTVTQKLIWHQTRPPEPIRNLRPEVPKDLETVINKMMAKKPVHRFQEPTAVVAALAPWTEQPIEPPADEEMPRLCPALRDYSTAGGPHSSVSGPPSTVRGRGRGGPRTDSLSRKSMPRMPIALPWYKKRSIVVGGGSAAVLIIALGLYWLFHTPSNPEPPSNPPPVAKGHETQPTQPSTPNNLPVPPVTSSGDLPPPTAGRWYVAGGPSATGRTDVFPTLAAAIEKASAGDTVTVLLPEVEGTVTLDARRAGVHLESGLANGQMVVWRPSAGASADVPLLKLDSAGAARIKGFTFDGGDRLNSLIQVTGVSSGLRFEDLYLTDAGKKSIVLTSAVSTKEQPVTLERVRVTTLREYWQPANQKSAAAMRPSAVECVKGVPNATLALNIRWCRFEGIYLEAILFECPIDATIEFCRFYALKSDERPENGQTIKAVSVRQLPPSATISLSLISNTMARFSQFLRIERLTAADTGYHFVVRNNLALGSSGDSWVWSNNRTQSAVAKPFFEGSGGNVCRPNTLTYDKQLPDAVVPRKHIAFNFLELGNVASDAFLRYKKTGDTAALMTAGTDGGPVGVPPLE